MLTTLLRPFYFVDRRIDQLGMYRVVTLALSFLTVIALVCGAIGWLPYTFLELSASLGVVLLSGMTINWLLAKLFQVHTNHESALITSLIVFFLVIPAQLSRIELSFIIALVTGLAMVSKYLIAWRGQHILNPAAAGAVAVGLVYEFIPLPPGYFEAGWWIGTPVLFVPLLLAVVVIVQKVRKWTPVLVFLSVAFVVFLFEEWRFTGELFTNWERFWLSGPSLFLAGFMLTEPFTMPPTKRLQGWYGGIVGVLSQATFLAPVLKMTPELALVIGNLAMQPFRLQQKLKLKLIKRQEIAESIYEFTFTKPAGLRFQAGQYLEWMLPHGSADSRGIRRYFTIASAPTESYLKLALKVVSEGSSYKQALMQLDEGEQIIASQLAGDFLLPADTTQKLGFIAGGIGVTPFRSHLMYMRDSDKVHDTALFYCANTAAELAYYEDFEKLSQSQALSVIPVLAKEEREALYEHGFVTADMLARRVPDYLERHWYISGPPPMVRAYRNLLSDLGVKNSNITTDFFPGLA